MTVIQIFYTALIYLIMLDFCITDIPCTSNELRTFTMRDLSLKKILRFSKYFKKVKYDIIYI